MEVIARSLNTALVRGDWLFGEKFPRIEDRFVWVDTEQIGSYKK